MSEHDENAAVLSGLSLAIELTGADAGAVLVRTTDGAKPRLAAERRWAPPLLEASHQLWHVAGERLQSAPLLAMPVVAAAGGASDGTLAVLLCIAKTTVEPTGLTQVAELQSIAHVLAIVTTRRQRRPFWRLSLADIDDAANPTAAAASLLLEYQSVAALARAMDVQRSSIYLRLRRLGLRK